MMSFQMSNADMLKNFRRYYDSQGNPTKYLKGVEIKAKRGAQLEKQKSEEAKIPSCNSKWSEEEGREVSILCTIAFLRKHVLSAGHFCLLLHC
jgi:hypothetical protein